MPAKNLRLVLYNLLSNALRCCQPDREPYMRLTCPTEYGYWCLSVQDNSLEVNADQQASLFTLFQLFFSHVEDYDLGCIRDQENCGEHKWPGRSAERAGRGFHLPGVLA